MLCAGMRGTEGCEAVRVIRGTPELKVVELEMTCVGNDGFYLIGKRETGGQKDKDGGMKR